MKIRQTLGTIVEIAAFLAGMAYAIPASTIALIAEAFERRPKPLDWVERVLVVALSPWWRR